MLAPLRARTHSLLRWDERYVPYLRRAGMLPLARVVCAGLPAMDAPLLTTFVDRWRPETHSFHLPCGEVTITLQDVAMILGLPLEGIAVTSIILNDGIPVREAVQGPLLGLVPKPCQGAKLSRHPKAVKSPTAKATQKMRTQAFRCLGCRRCLMLP